MKLKKIVKDVNPCEKRMRVLHFHEFAWDRGAMQKIPCIIKLEKNKVILHAKVTADDAGEADFRKQNLTD